MSSNYKFFCTITVLSFSIKVLSNSSNFLDRFRQLTSEFQLKNKEGDANVEYKVFLKRSGDGQHIIRKNGVIVYKTHDRVDLLITLLVYSQNDFIQNVEGHIVLHSALVIKNGNAIVLPAPGKSGKSTLVLSLLKHGFKYFSDEITAINLNSFRASGLPRAIMIRDKTLSLFPFLKPEIIHTSYKLNNTHKSREIHFGIPSKKVSIRVDKSFPISAIIFPKYSPNGHTLISDIRNSTAVLNLMNCTLNQNSFTDTGFRTAARIVRKMTCYTLQIKDLSRACEFIDGLT